MPLTAEAHDALADLSKASGDFTLCGVFLNPVTGELGTYSSHGLPVGATLAFLQQAVDTLLQAAMNGELQGVDDGRDGTGQERALLSKESGKATKASPDRSGLERGAKGAFLVH